MPHREFENLSFDVSKLDFVNEPSRNDNIYLTALVPKFEYKLRCGTRLICC